MTAVATETWGLVFWQQEGESFAAITGPESRTSSAPVPRWSRFVGIQFAVGTAVSAVPAASLVDSGLPLSADGRTFELDGRRWETPGAPDAEMLVDRLVRSGTVVRDPLVARVVDGGDPASSRTQQRRFRAVTGLTRTAVAQIQRARAAASMLSTGLETAEVVSRSGFYDEPHLARDLRRYIGRTAGQLRTGDAGVLALPDSADDVVERLEDAVPVPG